MLINRIDPDTNTFAGIDWARVWGGNYREVFLDLGAAPNPYESQTWGNRRRDPVGSDAFDGVPERRAAHHGHGRLQRPVLAEPDLDVGLDVAELNLGRFVIEPRPTGSCTRISTSRDPASAGTTCRTTSGVTRSRPLRGRPDLTKLFDQNVVLAGLRTLVPYFTFTGDTQYEYLTPLDADQQNLQQAKQDGDDVAGTPFTAMHTQTAMDYLDANPAKFKRGGSCYTTIPDLEVVVEKHYAWDLPLIVGGVATNNGGRPWGFLASVNDVFKTAQSDEDQEGPLHFIHPDILGGGLSYTSIHELSHFLGLAHPHDTIGLAKVDTDFDGTTDTTEYWDGFSWTFDSTAAPTTHGTAVTDAGSCPSASPSN